jgi:putative hydrolase of the HAD superfamily
MRHSCEDWFVNDLDDGTLRKACLILEACLLDLDDTLYDRSDAFRRLVGVLYDSEPAISEATSREDAIQLVSGWDMASPADVTRDQARRCLFSRVRARWPGIDKSTSELVEWYKSEIVRNIRPRKGLQKFLSAMGRSHVPWAILSNGDRLQFLKLKALGIPATDTIVVLSEEVGVRKPDPRIFREALRRLGHLNPGTVLMVGDDPVADISGAASVGMMSAWISAGRKWSEVGVEPNYVVEDFCPLLNLIR